MNTARIKWLLDDALAAPVLTVENLGGHTLMEIIRIARDEIERLDECLSRISSVDDRPESVTKLLLEYGVLVQPQDGPTLFDSLDEPIIFDAATDTGPWEHRLTFDADAPTVVITEIKENTNGPE